MISIKEHSPNGRSFCPEYKSWMGIKDRCLNEKCKHYPSYGGRGIGLCNRWLDFEKFFEDMGPKPSPKHSIDRINNNEGYDPDNCRWTTQLTQMNNTRRNAKYEAHGKLQTITEWARDLGIPDYEVRRRLAKYSIEDALSKEPNPQPPKVGRPKVSFRDDASVKIDRAILDKSRVIAKSRGVSMARYLSGLLKEKVDLDFLEATKQK
jgi:hypothetical protein